MEALKAPFAVLDRILSDLGRLWPDLKSFLDVSKNITNHFLAYFAVLGVRCFLGGHRHDHSQQEQRREGDDKRGCFHTQLKEMIRGTEKILPASLHTN